MKCIQPELGADPSGSAAYFTVHDYKEILQFADDRHIQVIPEIDMPGHGYAAIKSMEARYRKLRDAGDVEGAEKYLLTDFKDTSQYVSVQLFNDNTINPCLESTYNFISHVIEAIVRMHSGIQPLTAYHFGGDEVARGAWEHSKECTNILAKHQTQDTRATLKEYFIKRVSKLTARHGLTLGGWGDAFLSKPNRAYGRESFDNKEVFANAWNNLNGAGGGERAHVLANAGYKVS
jgi:hexosaminidase